ncbi:CPBP family intramembrane metalloprotease [Nocardia brasiliensis]|uniref:CPBP family intramembrane metalloprotease n=1 Tax=Nocardia brasiliensis TaxID=37326 RepID=A0A6G9XM14_NOCBR|nr:CPBP family intramembrane glutamic endopeptidase [Nocardia brasiliensis]QIS01944.1 CPBP family intramembrane metalloprotease [Nocardia brasiliensis]
MIIRVGIVFVAATVWWLVLYHVFAPPGEYTRSAHVTRAVGAAVFTVPMVLLARKLLDRRSLDGLGFSSVAGGCRAFLVGAALWGIPAWSAMALMLWLGWADVTVLEPFSRTLPALLGLLVLVLLYEAVSEELIFRGYFFANLNEHWSTASTVVGQAALFTGWGVLIGAAGSLGRALLFFTFSLVLGVLRAATGNIMTCMGFHAAFQVTTQFLANNWNYVDLHDPDLSIQGLAFVLLPFLTAPLAMWWWHKNRRPIPAPN